MKPEKKNAAPGTKKTFKDLASRKNPKGGGTAISPKTAAPAPFDPYKN